ncbi:hypothetical protein ACLESO_33600 [Pyxidicoccus sp. 3LG]
MAGHEAQRQVQVERLSSLLRDVYEGKLLLPEVPLEPWDEERRVRLFERVHRGLPIGSITVWRTSTRVNHRSAIGGVPLRQRMEGASRDYVVEGLDWLVTLFEELGSAFWREDASSTRAPFLPVDSQRSFLTYELQSQTLRSIGGHEPLRPSEIALAQVFDAQAQHALSARFRKGASGEQWVNRLSRFVGAFFDFTLPVITIVSDSPESARLLLPLKEEVSPRAERAPSTIRWYCDVCGQTILHSKDGWVEWLVRGEAGERVGRGLRLVHHRPASPRPAGCQYVEREELNRDGSILADLELESFLGADGLTELLSIFSRYNLPPEQVIKMIQRLHTPGYERARFHAEEASAEGIIDSNLPGGFYRQDEIAKVLAWADEQGRKP